MKKFLLALLVFALPSTVFAVNTVIPWSQDFDSHITTPQFNATISGSYQMTIASNCQFYITEVGIITDPTAVTVVTQPTLSVGNLTNSIKYLNASTATALTGPLKIQRWPVSGSDGESTLVFTLVGGTISAGSYNAKGYVRGQRACW